MTVNIGNIVVNPAMTASGGWSVPTEIYYNIFPGALPKNPEDDAPTSRFFPRVNRLADWYNGAPMNPEDDPVYVASKAIEGINETMRGMSINLGWMDELTRAMQPKNPEDDGEIKIVTPA